MNIAIRMEGGLGDILCANRFIPAILDKYPNAEICAYLDTEGNFTQENALKSFYPHFYKNIITIPSKKYKPFAVSCQFNPCDWNFGALENIPDKYVIEMTQNYDLFFDLHIDGMKWVKYDLPYLKYFYHFPTPKITERFTDSLPDKFVLLHLASNNLANGHRCDNWYYEGLVKKIAQNIPCVLLSTPTTRDYLKFLFNIPNVHIIETNLEKVVDVISRASVMLAIDSGLSYFGYGFGIPTYVLSSQATGLGQVFTSHKMRWLIFEKNCIPLYYDNTSVARIITNTFDNPALWLCPDVYNFESNCIVRNYTVNTEKSILQ